MIIRKSPEEIEAMAASGQIVARCLAKDPGQRYPSAAALAVGVPTANSSRRASAAAALRNALTRSTGSGHSCVMAGA